MRPVLTAAEMAEVDAKAGAEVGFDVLVARAGRALAGAALRLLGGAYGRRVVVVAGKGHNGDDGRVAARHLSGRGAHVTVLAPADGERLPACDLVIDAAFGTGFRGRYVAPEPPAGALVLAADLPSGLHPDTGEAPPEAVAAHATVTFGALKPGLLLGEGPAHAGAIEVAPIGLPLGEPAQHLVADEDIADWLAPRARASHKWKAAVCVVAGSPGMTGAARLSATGAYRAGAGMVRLGSPGVGAGGGAAVTEAVALELAAAGFAAQVLAVIERFGALVLGPGLGGSPATVAGVCELVEKAPVPLVLDADGLNALGPSLVEALSNRRAPVVVTPHDGEFARIAGGPPGRDRLAAARLLARRSGAVVLLKGPTTVVADRDGAALVVGSGSARLATAGSGDVLSGVIGAFLARGLPPLRAAGLAAHVHGRAAGSGLAEGLTAGDLPLLVAGVLSRARALG